MLKKIIGLALVLSLIAFVFSCGDSNAGSGGGDAEIAGEGAARENTGDSAGFDNDSGGSQDYLPDGLEDRDFGGYEFRVLTRSTCVHPLYIDAESITGELINDAIYQRNRAIEERFNVVISALIIHEGAPETDNANSTPFARRSIMSGEDFADIAMLHKIDSGALAAQGLFIDWHSVANADLSKP